MVSGLACCQVDQEARGSPKDVLKLKWFEIEQPQERRQKEPDPCWHATPRLNDQRTVQIQNI
eukprot:1662068-Amphidinium_carterae.1